MLINSFKDGSVVYFKEDNYDRLSGMYYLKVCGKDGIGGVVRLISATYFPISQLENYGINPNSAELVCETVENLFED